MNTAFAWIGAIVAVAISLAILIGVGTCAYTTLRDRLERLARLRETRRIANFLRGSASWFGEDQPTAGLLRDLADQYEDGNRFVCESDAREKWREARALGDGGPR